jgi:uncharacterized membrane protein
MKKLKQYFKEITMSLRQFFKSMLSDSLDPNIVSSKRVMTLVAMILCVIGFIGNMFFGYKIDQYIYDSMMFIVISGFGFTGLEKFALGKKTS